MAVLRVGAEQLRRELSHILARVGYGGDHVIVERHGSPQAVLIPSALYEQLTDLFETPANRDQAEAELEQTLVREGLLRLPDRPAADQPAPPRRLIQTQGKPLSEIIIEERR